jgi:NTP pyrophosphatase (non-canonical NTP hydrolase)
MNTKITESLGLLQEECAEVIVEVSKCNRFGLNSTHYKTGLTHLEMLAIEIADVLTLVDYLLEIGILDQSMLEIAKEAKKQKLKKWSKIYE